MTRTNNLYIICKRVNRSGKTFIRAHSPVYVDYEDIPSTFGTYSAEDAHRVELHTLEFKDDVSILSNPEYGTLTMKVPTEMRYDYFKYLNDMSKEISIYLTNDDVQWIIDASANEKTLDDIISTLMED
jgi:hypothetical protein